ncbi:ABC-F family ATP-binding cassette domain-containing protein [Paucilactobacillus wasatchensis]|uniref:ATPase component n=1 Tax=Paucilactobacillus wasatchensis TaxID=1335616 RepID=A0A0D1A832_9LACO|nr:ABC-F family ATP-binding cassette domain-containing protein [Paucilactobacillus wasatchensis]KIS03980.1 ATPase component [Paucilactobacillus wasatchensis]
MSLLEVDNLSMSFADKKLYDDASFQLNQNEHMGIVGQNGAGKSTLIKILTDTVLPVTGEIKWQKNIRIGYLDQYADIPAGTTLIDFLHTAFADLYKINDLMNTCYEEYATNMDDKMLERAGRYQEQLEARNFYDIETEIERVMSGLGLNEIGPDHVVSEMSGGQRSKIILAKLLLESPDVILLDEPTNYLDTAHIDWLITYLNDFNGAVMVISHDYDFLEQVTNCICDVSFGKITKYRGSFKQAMRQKEERKETQLREYEKQQVQIEKAERFITKNKAGSKATMAKSREKMLARMERIDPPSENLVASFKFPYENTGSQNALHVEELSVGYSHPLLAPVTFSMTMGEKLIFKGFNGVGKSTLIKSILGKIPAKGGESTFSPSAIVNYFDQDLEWDNAELSPLQTIQEQFPTMMPRTIRTRLAGAGINAANAMKPMNLLSGGEQTKVKLAILELTPANFLIMDEPTNHLDDETKEGLKKALQAFPGNLILVSHEESFYTGWVDKVLNVEKLSLKK